MAIFSESADWIFMNLFPFWQKTARLFPKRAHDFGWRAILQLRDLSKLQRVYPRREIIICGIHRAKIAEECLAKGAFEWPRVRMRVHVLARDRRARNTLKTFGPRLMPNRAKGSRNLRTQPFARRPRAIYRRVRASLFIRLLRPETLLIKARAGVRHSPSAGREKSIAHRKLPALVGACEANRNRRLSNLKQWKRFFFGKGGIFGSRDKINIFLKR